jgi:hypothetical protein
MAQLTYFKYRRMDITLLYKYWQKFKNKETLTNKNRRSFANSMSTKLLLQ